MYRSGWVSYAPSYHRVEYRRATNTVFSSGSGTLGFRRVNGVYRGSAYQTRSDWTRSVYRRGGVASLGYAMSYIGFPEWCISGWVF